LCQSQRGKYPNLSVAPPIPGVVSAALRGAPTLKDKVQEDVDCGAVHELFFEQFVGVGDVFWGQVKGEQPKFAAWA